MDDINGFIQKGLLGFIQKGLFVTAQQYNLKWAYTYKPNDKWWLPI